MFNIFSGLISPSIMLTRFGGDIEGAEAIRKSYPDFFNDLNKIGIEVNYNAE